MGSRGATPKRRSAPRTMRSHVESEVARLSRELNEALERETATSEILASLGGSTHDTRPVFETILDNLLRLFGTRFAAIFLVRDGMLHLAGLKGDPGFEKFAQLYPLPLDDRLLTGRAIRAGRPLQIVPVVGNSEAPPSMQKMAADFGYNALLSAPLIHEGKIIGAMNTAHRDPTPFTEKQIALVKNFAAQAAIAIENTRLFEAEQQRTRELSESLEQQTATSEVLRVISSSPGEELMTFSTSDVAVCCSRDSRNSLSSRVFSMAMTAWAAKDLMSATCLSVNGTGSRCAVFSEPITLP